MTPDKIPTEIKTVGELKQYLSACEDDEQIDIESMRTFLFKHKRVVYLFTVRLFFHALKQWLKGLWHIDEERGSILVLMSIITFGLLVYEFIVTKKTNSGLVKVMTCLIVAIAGYNTIKGFKK